MNVAKEILFPKMEPRNRSEIRAYNREVDVVYKWVLNFECDYCRIGEQDFKIWNSMFLSGIKKLSKSKKFKYVMINPDYFMDTYKPVEENSGGFSMQWFRDRFSMIEAGTIKPQFKDV